MPYLPKQIEKATEILVKAINGPINLNLSSGADSNDVQLKAVQQAEIILARSQQARVNKILPETLLEQIRVIEECLMGVAAKENGDSKFIHIKTFSRGGVEPNILTQALDELDIEHGYGMLPSLDIWLYPDGTITSLDRNEQVVYDHNYQTQPLIKHRRVKQLSEVTTLQDIYVKAPNALTLYKQIPEGKVLKVIGNTEFWGETLTSRGEFDCVVVLHPKQYQVGLTANEIDGDSSEIISREYLHSLRALKEFPGVRVQGNDLCGVLAANPVRLRQAAEAFVVGAGKNRLVINKGDWFGWNSGFEGTEDRKPRVYTNVELELEVEKCGLILCDETGKALEQTGKLRQRINSSIIEK